MIKTIVGLAIAGIALLPYAEKAETPWVAEFGVDPIVTSAKAAEPAIRRLKVAAMSGTCMIEIAGAGNVPLQVRPEPSCASVHAGLEGANSWLSDGESALIADASGRTILGFGPSDGFAYESLPASGAIVTLSDIDI
ncbi:MAG: hypothetical protein WCC66_06950 [Rhizobiaceae bacterium]